MLAIAEYRKHQEIQENISLYPWIKRPLFPKVKARCSARVLSRFSYWIFWQRRGSDAGDGKVTHMRNHPGFHAAFLAPCLLVAACGGGSGGGGAVVPPQVTPPLPPTSGIPVNLQSGSAPLIYQAAAVTAVGAKTSMGNVTISAAGQGATITLTTDAGGNLKSVAIPAGGITDTGVNTNSGRKLTDPLTLDFGYQLSDTFAFGDEYSYTLTQIAAAQGLTASAYGLWASSLIAPASAGALAFGDLTPQASVPATGSATFNGTTIGIGGPIATGANSALKGDTQIIANFATQSVTTKFSNFTAGVIPDLSGSSIIAGNAYAGTLSGGALTGTINGNFYGSAAQETAGVWQASGGGNAWIGSYGAKQ